MLHLPSPPSEEARRACLISSVTGLVDGLTVVTGMVDGLGDVAIFVFFCSSLLMARYRFHRVTRHECRAAEVCARLLVRHVAMNPRAEPVGLALVRRRPISCGSAFAARASPLVRCLVGCVVVACLRSLVGTGLSWRALSWGTPFVYSRSWRSVPQNKGSSILF